MLLYKILTFCRGGTGRSGPRSKVPEGKGPQFPIFTPDLSFITVLGRVKFEENTFMSVLLFKILNGCGGGTSRSEHIYAPSSHKILYRLKY